LHLADGTVSGKDHLTQHCQILIGSVVFYMLYLLLLSFFILWLHPFQIQLMIDVTCQSQI